MEKKKKKIRKKIYGNKFFTKKRILQHTSHNRYFAKHLPPPFKNWTF